MREYYRVMLGANSVHAQESHDGSFIGADFGIDQDLAGDLAGPWEDFHQKIRPMWMEQNPGKNKVAAGLASGSLFTVGRGILDGDVVLCPNGLSGYWVGEVVGPYSYNAGGVLPHRRPVHWLPKPIRRDKMSEALRNSTGSIGTVSKITKFAEEIEWLISGQLPSTLISTDETEENPFVFALEKHLEEFLVANWRSTELGKNYDIYEVDGQSVGKQYPAGAGFIDILAISKDKKELLVIELKKGLTSDAVLGQIQRYMGYVLDDLAEADQSVKGVIIATDDDINIRMALKVTQWIEFYRYQVSFKLTKAL